MDKKKTAQMCCELAAKELGTTYVADKHNRTAVLCRKIAAYVVMRLWPLTTMQELAECFGFSRTYAVKILQPASDFEQVIVDGYVNNVHKQIKELS